MCNLLDGLVAVGCTTLEGCEGQMGYRSLELAETSHEQTIGAGIGIVKQREGKGGAEQETSEDRMTNRTTQISTVSSEIE